MTGAGTTPVTRPPGGRGGRGELSMVGEATPRSYYGQPVLKRPVWEPEVGIYLFTGGLAGGAGLLAAAARLSGNPRLARSADLTALAGAAVSPVLLIRDLGRPSRFHHMLRVFKPTSPMNLGTWILSAFGTAAGAAAGCELLGILPRARAGAEAAMAVLGPLLSTYTAVLLADTAIPVWHEARTELPFVFAGSAAASGAAAALLLTPVGDARPARRLCLGGVAVELAATELMERRLGELGDPYREGTPSRYARAARGLLGAGAGLIAVGGRSRAVAAAGAIAVLAGSLATRWSVFTAGAASADDPRYTVGPQQRRLDHAASTAG